MEIVNRILLGVGIVTIIAIALFVAGGIELLFANIVKNIINDAGYQKDDNISWLDFILGNVLIFAIACALWAIGGIIK